MAKNLFFTLAGYRRMGFEFITHRGALISLQPGLSTKVLLGDDEYMSDKELIEYYDARYKVYGLTTRILNNSVPTINNTPVVKEQEQSNDEEEIPQSDVVESQNLQSDSVNAFQGNKEPLYEENKSDEINLFNVVDPTENLKVKPTLADMEEITIDDVTYRLPVKTWEYREMVKFVKEKNLKLGGNSKKDHIAGIESFMNHYIDNFM